MNDCPASDRSSFTYGRAIRAVNTVGTVGAENHQVKLPPSTLTQTPADDLSQTDMGKGLTRGRHRKGELPIPTTENIPLQEKTPVQERLPFHERIRRLPKHPSSLQLELPVPEFLHSAPPSACHSLNDLDQEFRLNGLNGDIGLSNNYLCVPGSLQEVNY